MKGNPTRQSGPYYAQQAWTHFDGIPLNKAEHQRSLQSSMMSVQSGASRKERSITAGADDAKGRRRALTFKQPQGQQQAAMTPDRR